MTSQVKKPVLTDLLKRKMRKELNAQQRKQTTEQKIEYLIAEEIEKLNKKGC